MSYTVFARKYRPQTFDDVVGQEHITRTLKNAILQNRLAHAYLFVGPRGTGKTSTARILAKALNCLQSSGPTVEPCGECDSCREIASGNSLDVLEFDAASNTQVEKVREIIIENVKFLPARGRFKVYLVDEVHMLSTGSFNALLKTLEEPPPHVKFLFATTDVQKLPATILSRCQRFDLKRIGAPVIAGHLLQIAANEGVQLSDEGALAIAVGADGGMRDAESMLDQLVAFCGGSIGEEQVLSVFGFSSQQKINDLCHAVLAEDASAALAIVHQQVDDGRDLTQLLSGLITHLRNLLLVQADPATVAGELGEELAGALRQQCSGIARERLLELIDMFSTAEQRMRWAANKQMHLEVALLRAIHVVSQVTLSEVVEALTAIREGREPKKPGVRAQTIPAAPLPRAKMMQPRMEASLPKTPAVQSSLHAPTRALHPEVPVSQPASAALGAAKTVAPVPSTEPAPAGVSESAVQPEGASIAHPPAPPTAAGPVPSAPPVPEELLIQEEESRAAARPAKGPRKEKPASSRKKNSDEPAEETRESSSPVVETAAVSPGRTLEEVNLRLMEPVPRVEESPAAQELEPPAESRAEGGRTGLSGDADLGQLWVDLVKAIRLKRPLISMWLESGVLLSVDNGIATLGFPSEQSLAEEYIRKENNRSFLANVLSELRGGVLKVECVRREGIVLMPVAQEVPPPPEPPKDPMEEFQNDPLIEKALELFQARLESV